LNKKYNNVIIIGAGKIAYSIVPALHKAGYIIQSVISRNIYSAKKLAVKSGTRHYTDKLEEINIDKGIILLSVPDNRIETAAEELSRLKLKFNNLIFVHLSGALDISCLDSLKKRKGLTASLHIMQTFPSKKSVSIRGCYAAIETSSKTIEKILFELAKDILLKPFKLRSNAKPFYHLAGVFASNFLAGNLYSAQKAFNKTGNKNVDFYEMISPILYSTLSHIKKSGTVSALSGPVERRDIQTIKKHLSVLKKDALKTNNNSLLLNYIAQSLNLIEVAGKKHGNSEDNYNKIRKLLNEYL
jgi:predicted short-subunit dehydrogenase-like oxidoreductase (DUF2520 family)